MVKYNQARVKPWLNLQYAPDAVGRVRFQGLSFLARAVLLFLCLAVSSSCACRTLNSQGLSQTQTGMPCMADSGASKITIWVDDGKFNRLPVTFIMEGDLDGCNELIGKARNFMNYVRSLKGPNLSQMRMMMSLPGGSEIRASHSFGIETVNVYVPVGGVSQERRTRKTTDNYPVVSFGLLVPSQYIQHPAAQYVCDSLTFKDPMYLQEKIIPDPNLTFHDRYYDWGKITIAQGDVEIFDLPLVSQYTLTDDQEQLSFTGTYGYLQPGPNAVWPNIPPAAWGDNTVQTKQDVTGSVNYSIIYSSVTGRQYLYETFIERVVQNYTFYMMKQAFIPAPLQHPPWDAISSHYYYRITDCSAITEYYTNGTQFWLHLGSEVYQAPKTSKMEDGSHYIYIFQRTFYDYDVFNPWHGCGYYGVGNQLNTNDLVDGLTYSRTEFPDAYWDSTKTPYGAANYYLPGFFRPDLWDIMGANAAFDIRSYEQEPTSPITTVSHHYVSMDGEEHQLPDTIGGYVFYQAITAKIYDFHGDPIFVFAVTYASGMDIIVYYGSYFKGTLCTDTYRGLEIPNISPLYSDHDIPDSGGPNSIFNKHGWVGAGEVTAAEVFKTEIVEE